MLGNKEKGCQRGRSPEPSPKPTRSLVSASVGFGHISRQLFLGQSPGESAHGHVVFLKDPCGAMGDRPLCGSLLRRNTHTHTQTKKKHPRPWLGFFVCLSCIREIRPAKQLLVGSCGQMGAETQTPPRGAPWHRCWSCGGPTARRRGRPSVAGGTGGAPPASRCCRRRRGRGGGVGGIPQCVCGCFFFSS